MADEPVSAWREPFSRRARRWARPLRRWRRWWRQWPTWSGWALAGIEARANNALERPAMPRNGPSPRPEANQATDTALAHPEGLAAGRGGQHVPRRRVPQSGPRVLRPGGQGGGCPGPGRRPARQGVRRVAGDQGGAPGSPGPDLLWSGAVRRGREPAHPRARRARGGAGLRPPPYPR